MLPELAFRARPAHRAEAEEEADKQQEMAEEQQVRAHKVRG